MIKIITQTIEKQLNSFSKEVSFKFLEKKKFKKIVFVGMGGSGLAARMIIELKKELFLKNGVDFFLCQNYSLPENLPKNESLVIIVSYSGKTKESLACFKEAKKRGIETIFISANENLKRQTENKGTDFFLLEKTLSPRYSLISQLSIILAILEKLNICPKKIKIKFPKIEEIIEEAKNFSKKIDKKNILIYSFQENYFLAYHLKIHLNEDGKIPAFSNILPEAVHNEFLSLTKERKNFFLIFLRDKECSLAQKHLKAIFKNLKRKSIPFVQIKIGKKNLENYLKQIVFNTFFSFFVARERKREVLENDFLKKIKNDFN